MPKPADLSVTGLRALFRARQLPHAITEPSSTSGSCFPAALGLAQRADPGSSSRRTNSSISVERA